MRSTRRAPLTLYVVLTYLTFWVLIGATGAVMLLKPPAYVIRIMQNLCAWSPTLVILFLFKRLYPGMRFTEYLRRNFRVHVNPLVFVLILAVQAAVVSLALGAHAVLTGTPLSAISFISLSSLPSLLLINLTSGPTGEELGWRGFVFNELRKRHTAFVSALMVGLIWGFWHIPLWILSGFTGLDLVVYVLSFMVGIVSLSVVITAFYHHHRNILIPMWIHFLFNFLLQLTTVDPLAQIAYATAFYFLLAVIVVIYDRTALFSAAPKPDDTQAAPAFR